MASIGLVAAVDAVAAVVDVVDVVDVDNLDAAATALQAVAAAAAQVAPAKHSVLGAGAALQAALATLKQVAARQAEHCAKHVKSLARRQQQVADRVDARLGNARCRSGGSSGVIVPVDAVRGLLRVRVITRRLDAAVPVAEAVSAGRLDDVPVGQGNDETAGLMTAPGRRVHTLRGMLVHGHQTRTAIQAGSHRLVQGNQDVRRRSGQQAGQRQQTVAAMPGSIRPVQDNSGAARQVDSLAAQARAVASQGGDGTGQPGGHDGRGPGRPAAHCRDRRRDRRHRLADQPPAAQCCGLGRPCR